MAEKRTRKRNAAKGKRYSASEKRAVLDYVESVNLERGRGGITAASKQFGVSPLTISNWMHAEGRTGMPTGGKRVKPSSEVFRRMAEVHEEIVKVESELTTLRKEYVKLKGKI